MKNDRKNKILVVFFGNYFDMIKRKKYLKEAENYDIVFTNKKSPAGNEPKGGSCCPGFLFKHNVRL